MSLIPIVGTIKSAYDLYKNPSWQNLGDLGISILTEIPFLKVAKLAKAAKTTKAIKSSAKTTAKAISRSKASTNSPININRQLEHVNFVEKANKELERYRKLKTLEEFGIGTTVDGGYSIYKNFIKD